MIKAIFLPFFIKLDFLIDRVEKFIILPDDDSKLESKYS
jgi:hypothetical protein